MMLVGIVMAQREALLCLHLPHALSIRLGREVSSDGHARLLADAIFTAMYV